MVPLCILTLASSMAADCEETLDISIENLLGTRETVAFPSIIAQSLYRDDGTFTGWLKDAGVIRWRFSGTWKLEGPKLAYEYTSSSLDRVPVGTRDEDEILSIGCGIVTYRTTGGIISRSKQILD